MSRRALAFTLLAILAAQFLGAIAFASVCFEPCPDDRDGANCPPVCAVCASCSHARQAIVQSNIDGVTRAFMLDSFASPVVAPPSPRASDIFHVPLFV
ncbi:MAG: hypothetical protein ACTHQM_19120 [Thermoanaerobaculia bacterium]